MLSGMSLEVSPVCLQLEQLVTFDVVKEVKVHAF